MSHRFYSHRTGNPPDQPEFGLREVAGFFKNLYDELRGEGFFDEYLGSYCVDAGDIPGKIRDPKFDILLKIRKRNLWPIEDHLGFWDEDDLFDIVEYLYQAVSKPIAGTYHSFSGCGMHWSTFNRNEGQAIFRERVNQVLDLYERPFELSPSGEILHKADLGFEAIFAADTPTDDANVKARVESAILRYRRHGATIDDRRQAVRDLADVLEYLRPKLKAVLSTPDENDLFNIANNFGIRHHNDRQRTAYDWAIWLSWMFYFYLATIHVVLRKMGSDVAPA